MIEKKERKVIVLASGGLDSTCLLHKVVEVYGHKNVIALSLYYGQKHKKELQYLRWQARKLKVKYKIEDLAQVFKFNKDVSALIQGSSREIVHTTYAEQLETHHEVSAYVPYRNGLFISYAAAVALQLDACVIYYGAHADDAAGNAYPDCSNEFIEAQAKAILYGTGNRVALRAPWKDMNKTEVVAQGIKCGMTQNDFAHTWSCYEGGDVPCGECGTCHDREKALLANGLKPC